MKTIKYMRIFMIMFLCGTFSACDFLKEDLPNSFDVDGYYQNQEQAVKGLYGLYSAVRDVVFGIDLTSITDLMADDMEFLNTDVQRRTLNNLTYDKRNKYFYNVWVNLYKVIGNANVVIDKSTQLTESEPAKYANDCAQIIGEAKFIRAWAYMHLLQLWGDVPLITAPTYSLDYVAYPQRDPADKIREQIHEDLTAAEVLNDSPYSITIKRDITYPMTITRSAVKLLHAKLYLLEKNYNKCISEVEYLVKDRYPVTFDLVSDFSLLFDVAETKNPERKKEVIWEIEAKAATSYNNKSHREFAPKSAIEGCKTTGYQNYVPSTSLFEAFSKQSSDKRYDCIYRMSGGKPCIMKKVDYLTNDQNMGGCGEVLLRFADAVLIYAEALNAIGDTPGAAEWINKIRNRAGLIRKIGSLTIGNIKPTLSQEVMQDTIIAERRMEFAHEGHRLYDLKRVGKWKTMIQRYNSDMKRYMADGSLNFALGPNIEGSTTAMKLTVPFVEIIKSDDDRSLLHPLPESEVLINKNLLPDNPGY